MKSTIAIFQRGGHLKVINNQKQQSYRKQTSRWKKVTGTEKLNKEGKVEVTVIILTSYRKTKTTISKWGSVRAPEHLPGMRCGPQAWLPVHGPSVTGLLGSEAQPRPWLHPQQHRPPTPPRCLSPSETSPWGNHPGGPPGLAAPPLDDPPCFAGCKHYAPRPLALTGPALYSLQALGCQDHLLTHPVAQTTPPSPEPALAL